MAYKDPAKAKEYAKRYHARNRERAIARVTAWVKDHAEHVKRYKASWYQANKEKIDAKAREAAKRDPDGTRIRKLRSKIKSRREGRDWYIRELIVLYNPGLKGAKIPQSLIQAYRANLNLKRLCRNQKTSRT